MHVLIVEDHPITVEAYISCLKSAPFFSESPQFTIVSSCKEGYEILNSSVESIPFDLALIDQSLPIYAEGHLFNGSQLALLLQKKYFSCKIIMITSHSDIITVYDIIKKVKPLGLIIKSDVSASSLLQGIRQTLGGKIFYSPTVERILHEVWSKQLMIDDKNRQILLYLSKGYKIQELESIVLLSTSAIKRRIAHMKEEFEVSDDSSLVKEAYVQGFI